MKKRKYQNFNLVKNTTGVTLNGVYVKDDYTEVIISMAWGGDVHFKPESDIKTNERRAKILEQFPSLTKGQRKVFKR